MRWRGAEGSREEERKEEKEKEEEGGIQGRSEKCVSPCRRESKAACFELDTGLREGKEKESPLRVCNHKLVLTCFSV